MKNCFKDWSQSTSLMEQKLGRRHFGIIEILRMVKLGAFKYLQDCSHVDYLEILQATPPELQVKLSALIGVTCGFRFELLKLFCFDIKDGCSVGHLEYLLPSA